MSEMKIHNTLPLLKEQLERWKSIPKESEFIQHYAKPMQKYVGDYFDDFYQVLGNLNWKEYRESTLECNDEKWEERLKKHIRDVEKLFNQKLTGEAVLFGSFHTIDGFARFDQGNHKLYLGIDESHNDGNYLDILMVHELTHVVREGKDSVWKGWNLNPKMSREEFLNKQPVIEHLFGEGFSCVISELLVPGEQPRKYCYQSAESYKHVLSYGKEVSERIHREIKKFENGDYGSLYNGSTYQPRMQQFTQYVWAFHWIKKLMSDVAKNNPNEIVDVCSKQFVEHALDFYL